MITDDRDNKKCKTRMVVFKVASSRTGHPLFALLLINIHLAGDSRRWLAIFIPGSSISLRLRIVPFPSIIISTSTRSSIVVSTPRMIPAGRSIGASSSASRLYICFVMRSHRLHPHSGFSLRALIAQLPYIDVVQGQVYEYRRDVPLHNDGI